MLSSSIDASLMLQCRSLFFPDRVQALTQTTQLVGDFLGHILSRTEIGDQGFFRLTHLDETLPLNVPIRCTSISDEAMEHCGELPGIEAHDYAVVLWLRDGPSQCVYTSNHRSWTPPLWNFRC